MSDLTGAISPDRLAALDREPCPEGFHWIDQPFSSCDECGLPAWEHAGMAVPATTMTFPLDEVELVLLSWRAR